MNEQRAPIGDALQGASNDMGELVERAFHYRGDVTIHTDDGGALTGYVFNRNSRASEPFAQLFDTQTGREISIPYRTITQVLFTGRDAAAASVQRFEAFQDRQEDPARAGSHPPRTRAE